MNDAESSGENEEAEASADDDAQPRFRIEDFKVDLADYLADLERYEMPFGKYHGQGIHHLPIEYLRWFLEKRGGFPTGRLGELMAFVYHTKADGAEVIFKRLRQRSEPENRGRDPF
jgi:uncharacterized protein (DUF3820 family)